MSEKDAAEARRDIAKASSLEQQLEQVDASSTSSSTVDGSIKVRDRDLMQRFADVRDAPFLYMAQHPRTTKLTIYFVLLCLYNAYLFYCIWRYVYYGLEWEWCDGLGFLIILTVLTYAGLLYYQVDISCNYELVSCI